MTDVNLFEVATRKKYRFPSPVGELTTEQLWDLPLLTRNGRPDLDNTARAINAELKDITEGSFVDVRPNPKKAELTNKLEIVKHVIATKMAEAQAVKDAADRAEKRAKIEGVLAKKGDQKLEGMSEEELKAELAKL